LIQAREGELRFTELRATLQRIVPCDAVTG
jgi:hypothetical protein